MTRAGIPASEQNLARERLGLIATLREQVTDERMVLHCEGSKREGMREVAAWCDTHDGDWRVLSVSTPASVLGDLRGRWSLALRKRYGDFENVASPERQVCGQIGRLDLLDASFAEADSDRKNPRRRDAPRAA